MCSSNEKRLLFSVMPTIAYCETILLQYSIYKLMFPASLIQIYIHLAVYLKMHSSIQTQIVVRNRKCDNDIARSRRKRSVILRKSRLQRNAK